MTEIITYSLQTSYLWFVKIVYVTLIEYYYHFNETMYNKLIKLPFKLIINIQIKFYMLHI